MTAPEQLLEHFQNPDQEMEAINDIYNSILDTSEPDKSAMMLLPVIAMLATGSLRVEDAIVRDPADQINTAAAIINISLGGYLPSIMTEAGVSDRDLDMAFESTLYYISSIAGVLQNVLAKYVDVDETSIAEDITKKVIKNLADKAQNN